MTALTEALKELAADSELKGEVVFRPRLEPFAEFDLQEHNQTHQEMRAHRGIMEKGVWGK